MKYDLILKYTRKVAKKAKLFDRKSAVRYNLTTSVCNAIFLPGYLAGKKSEPV